MAEVYCTSLYNTESRQKIHERSIGFLKKSHLTGGENSTHTMGKYKIERKFEIQPESYEHGR